MLAPKYEEPTFVSLLDAIEKTEQELLEEIKENAEGFVQDWLDCPVELAKIYRVFAEYRDDSEMFSKLVFDIVQRKLRDIAKYEVS